MILFKRSFRIFLGKLIWISRKVSATQILKFDGKEMLDAYLKLYKNYLVIARMMDYYFDNISKSYILLESKP